MQLSSFLPGSYCVCDSEINESSLHVGNMLLSWVIGGSLDDADERFLKDQEASDLNGCHPGRQILSSNVETRQELSSQSFNDRHQSISPENSTSPSQPDGFLKYLDLFRNVKKDEVGGVGRRDSNHLSCDSPRMSIGSRRIIQPPARFSFRRTSHNESLKFQGESSDSDAQDSGSHQCHECGKIFLHYQTLHAHKQMHLGRTQCPICQKVFSNIGNKNAHMKQHHPN